MVTFLVLFTAFYVTLLFPGVVAILCWTLPKFRKWLGTGGVTVKGRLLALVGLGPLAVVVIVGTILHERLGW